MAASPGHQKNRPVPNPARTGSQVLSALPSPSHLCQAWGFLCWYSFYRVGVSGTVQSVILFELYKDTEMPGLVAVGGETEAEREERFWC